MNRFSIVSFILVHSLTNECLSQTITNGDISQTMDIQPTQFNVQNLTFQWFFNDSFNNTNLVLNTYHCK